MLNFIFSIKFRIYSIMLCLYENCCDIQVACSLPEILVLFYVNQAHGLSSVVFK